MKKRRPKAAKGGQRRLKAGNYRSIREGFYLRCGFLAKIRRKARSARLLVRGSLRCHLSNAVASRYPAVFQKSVLVMHFFLTLRTSAMYSSTYPSRCTAIGSLTTSGAALESVPEFSAAAPSAGK